MLKIVLDTNLEFLNDMEKELLNIYCGWNFLKLFRIKKWIKAINVVRNSMINTKYDYPILADRWFLDDICGIVISEGGFKK